MKTTIDSSEVIDGYMDCALWSSVDESGTPLDDKYGLDEISPDLAAKMMSDCEDFTRANRADLLASNLADSQIGHDFWLTRNHHGAGFWDRGLGDLGDRLTKACKAFPSTELYVGDDGKIYQ